MRTILDRELRRWEVYVTTGEFGVARPARVAFRCTSDPGVRPRVLPFEAGKTEAERALAELPEAELQRWLDGAVALA